MRNTLFYVLAFLLILLPMTAESQMSLYPLPQRRAAFGVAFDYQRNDNLFKNICGDLEFNIRTFQTNIDYGFNQDIKISMIPGIRFTDVNLADVPLSPTAEIRLTNMGPLGTTTLDYFLIGSIGADYAQLHGACVDVLHLIDIELVGGIGLSHTLRTQSELVIIPFFGAFYSNIWRNISTQRQILIDSTSGLFTGQAGAEIELTKSISIIGTWNFSFENPENSYFQIGLNFH